MSLNKSEGWDSVTAPAIPAGWNMDAQLVTSASQYYSPLNSLSPTSGAAAVDYYGSWNADDGSGTDPVSIVMQCKVKLTNSGLTDYYGGIIWRGSAATFNNSSTSQYLAVCWSNLTIGYDRFIFGKIVNGGWTQFASVQLSAPFGTTGWYEINLVFSGGGAIVNSTQLYLRRMADGYWLTSSGGWQTLQTAAITSADNSITTGAYSGVVVYGDNPRHVWLDDWFINSQPLIGFTPYVASQRLPVPRFDNKAYWI